MIRLPSSIVGRLLLTACASTLAFILIIGLVLENAHKSSLKVGISDQMELVTYSLLAEAEIVDDQIRMPRFFQNNRLNQLQSGLMAWVASGSDLQWQSASTIWEPEFNELLNQELETGQTFDSHLETPSHAYFYRAFKVIWETESGEELPLSFFILKSQGTYQDQLWQFRSQLWIGMLELALGLILVLWLSMRIVLRPVTCLVAELKRVETGEESQLSHRYPKELQPVADNLNQVLQSEEQQRQRYHQTLADLAHSLKTPLAVMKASDQKQEQAEQLERMDQIISYQLGRAVVSQGQNYLGQGAAIKALAERLINALDKVYPHVEIKLVVAENASYKIPMAEKDLMEVLGNLLENACKYGKDIVEVRLLQNGFSIHDNGKGIAPDLKQQILKRGVRLDTLCAEGEGSSATGQGIGLAVVSDILSSYQISLDINDSELGGCCFEIKK